MKIVHVEDDPIDRRLLREALRRAEPSASLCQRGDGESLLRLVRETPCEGTGRRWQRPDLIVLDLGLPDVDGLSLLSVIRAHPRWRKCPVVVLTSQGSDRQDAARRFGASVHRKPHLFRDLAGLARQVVARARLKNLAAPTTQ